MTDGAIAPAIAERRVAESGQSGFAQRQHRRKERRQARGENPQVKAEGDAVPALNGAEPMSARNTKCAARKRRKIRAGLSVVGASQFKPGGRRGAQECDYGDDISRKKKLLEKQKKGKERMREYGNVSVPLEVFIAARIGEDSSPKLCGGGRMRVFHFSDIHWHDGNKNEIEVVISACLRDLDNFKGSTNPNDSVVVFTGDLVLAGEREGDFQPAYDSTIRRIAEFLDISPQRVLVCPGNHDMSRRSARTSPMLERAAKDELTSRDAINKFFAGIEGDLEKELLIERACDFYKWHDATFPDVAEEGLFLRTRQVDCLDGKVGFAMMNSAFRSVGEGEDHDNGYLIVGEKNIDEAINRLDGCNAKILLTHHPLDILQSVDKAATRIRLDREFHAHLFGHMHDADPIVYNRPLGSVVSAQSGSLYAGRDWFNGYQIIDLDILGGKSKFYVREYQPKSERFGAAESVSSGGIFEFELPVGDDVQSAIARILRELRDVVQQRALAHVDFADLSDEHCSAILEADALPLLYRVQLEEGGEEDALREERERTSTSEIVARQSNAYLLGPPQSGRTALAHDLAMKFTTAGPGKTRIPIVLSKSDTGKRFYELRKAIIRYAEQAMGTSDIEALAKNGAFAFIVDDLNFSNAEELEKFHAFTRPYDKNIWIGLGHRTSEGVAPEAQLRKHLPDFEICEINGLPRRAIRRLSEALASDKEEANQKFDLVMSQIRSEGMPQSPYIALLLIWANRQKLAGEKLNEALLLQNVMEHLLGRADFRTAKRGELGAVGKEIILQHVAKKITHNGQGLDENALITELVDFFELRKLPFFAADVLEKLLSCGILRRVGEEIDFKYDSFRKYFYALAMREEPALFQKNIEGLNFISFSSELELLSGLRLQNNDLIARIMEVLEDRKTDRFLGVDPRQLIDPADLGFVTTGSRKRLADIKNKRLSQQQVDDMLDRLDERAEERGEISPKQIINSDSDDLQKKAREKREVVFRKDASSSDKPLSLSTYMRALRLLARMVRNSDFSSFDEKGPAAAMVLEGYNLIYLSMMKDLSNILSEIVEADEGFNEAEAKFIRYAMGKLVFQILGHICVSVLSTPALAETIKGVLKEGEERPGVRLLSLFLLEDTNAQGWSEQWGKFIADKSITRFELENVIERLYEVVGTKALDPTQSQRFKEIGEDLEKRFDWSEAQSDRFRRSLSQTRNLGVLKDKLEKH